MLKYWKANSMLLLIASILSITTYAVENNDRSKDFKICMDGWVAGMTKNNPEITDKDKKSIARYFCDCALDQYDIIAAQLDAAEQRKQLLRVCLPYAVFRNTLQHRPETLTSDVSKNTRALTNACQFNFLTNKNNKEVNKAVLTLCQCASKPLSVLQSEKGNLSEEEIRNRVMQIVSHCTEE